MTQEKYLHSSHPTHVGYGCQKYLRPQSTRERQDAVKQQNVSKVAEVTLLQIFWSPFRRSLQSLKLCESFSWDVSAFLASFLTAVTQQTYFTGLQQLSAGLPHSPGYFLFWFNFVKPLKRPKVFLLVGLPSDFHPWHGKELPAPCTPAEPRDLQNYYRGRNVSLFLLWSLAVITKLASYSEVIEQWGCSLYSSMKLLPRVILSAVLRVGQSYTLFKGLEEVAQLCETDFEFPSYSWTDFLCCILPFCTLQVHPHPFLSQWSFNPFLFMLQLSTRTGLFL